MKYDKILEKSDFSRLRLSNGGLILLQSFQTRTQNDRRDQELHYCEPQSNPRCPYTFLPSRKTLHSLNSRSLYSFQQPAI